MKADLQDALVPVKWAQAQMPILKQRLIDWQRTDPYTVNVEPDPSRSDRQLLVAYLKKPLDPNIIGDVGAMINSIRTGLDLMMAAVVARHNVLPDRAPNFPIYKKATDFLAKVNELEGKKWLSKTEAAWIKRMKAYNGGDVVLWHIGKLDNLRKHQRLLTVEPVLSDASFTVSAFGFQKLMTHLQNKSILYSIPNGTFRPHKGNTIVTAEIFLNESPAGIGDREAFLALRVYIQRVTELIKAFP
jgi:hypothetical protein